MNVPTIAIIGGGLAGLTCAFRLLQHGINSTVYEAQNRLGGRCWTERGFFKNFQFIERGGELINSNHTSILNLIEELGLSLDDLVASEFPQTRSLFSITNRSLPLNWVENDILRITNILKEELELAGFPPYYFKYTQRAWELDHMSVLDWINEKVDGGIYSNIGKILCTAFTIENGEKCSEQSALNILKLFATPNPSNMKPSIFGYSDQKYRVQGGNDLIIKRLTTILKEKIHLEYKLCSIIQNQENTCTLAFQTKSGKKLIHVDKVVLALPFYHLHHSVDLSNSGFKPLKMKAIKELGMGEIAKIHYQFNNRYWEQLGLNGTVFSDKGLQHTFESSRAQPGKEGVIAQFSGGNELAQMMNLSETEETELFLDEIDQRFPGIKHLYSGEKCKNLWLKSSWSGGSYSYRKIGQYTSYAGIEMEREGNCYFAGEHTSILFQGYMNGAVESGNRVAKEILLDYT